MCSLSLWLLGNQLPALLLWLFVGEIIFTSCCTLRNDVLFFDTSRLTETPDVSKMIHHCLGNVAGLHSEDNPQLFCLCQGRFEVSF